VASYDESRDAAEATIITSEYLRCEELGARQSVSFLRQYEIAITHALSLPVPTMRGHSPGYITFAAPALRRPGKPQIQEAPDRWWIYSALDGRLVTYALCSAIPLANGTTFESHELPLPEHGLAELKGLQSSAFSLLDILSPHFSCKEPGDTARRKRLIEILMTFISLPLLPQYRAAAPDFFGWLEASR
jgi:hypothetical protein